MSYSEIVQDANNTIVTALKFAYRKHALMDDSIGWQELGEWLRDALCEAIGDDGFYEWSKELTQKTGEVE